MTYEETLHWMFQRLPMYQRIGGDAYKKDMGNIQKFSEHLGHPELLFKTIHIAGTNGKGSVSHMLASVLQESGYKVGLYTSPHLRDFRERIRINGEQISENAVVSFIEQNRTFLERSELSFFEMSVGMAFKHFAKEKVDIAVIEVGLGGRLDSTNIITPELSVITNIGLDHTAILGTTYPEIAAEKAGIIKRGIPVVVGEVLEETLPVFESVAKENQAILYLAEKEDSPFYESDLKGNYQKKNLRTVSCAVEILRKSGWTLNEDAVKNGLAKVVENTGLLGRWQILRTSPKVICDTAHNMEGLEYVIEQLLEEKFKSLRIVLGLVKEKDLNQILPLFPLQAMYYFAKPDVPRGMEASLLKEEAEKRGLKGGLYSSVSDAYAQALKEADSEDLIFIGGSNFTVAEIV